MATSAPTPVTNPPDPLAPKMNGNWRRDILGQVREGTFARKDPESYAKYQEYTKQAEDALYQKYYAEEVSNFGKNASTVNARKDAIIDARAAANQRFATEISSAGAGTLVSEQVTQPVLPQQPQPPSSATTPVSPAVDPQVPGQSRLVNTADDLFGPVDPATDPQVPSGRPPTLPSGRPIPTPVNPAVDPQVPAAASPLPPARPISTFPGAVSSFNLKVGDVRADGAVLTQFLSDGTPVWVIRPAETTPTPVNPAVDPQVPPDGVISDDPLQVRLGGVVITNQADLNTLVRLGNDVIVTQNNLYRNGLIRPRNPAVIATENELRERLAREEASLERFRNAAIARARTAPPVNPAVDPANITGDESAFVPTRPGVASPEPVSIPAPAAPAAPIVPAVTEPFPLPNDVDPNFITQPAVATIPSPGEADQDLANQTFANRENAKLQATIQAQRKQANDGDWRVKLRLAAGAKYLYKATEPGILEPLSVTDGVVFPYTPKINTSYSAMYSPTDLTHSNNTNYFYQGSKVGEVKISAVFTAQDTFEANYLLAVIHFFRSVTKMFYGQDQQYRGAPPPLVFLQGLGEYQFNLHPCVVSQFDYVLPDDVDYIRARSVSINGTNLLQRRDRQTVSNGEDATSSGRLAGAGLSAGGIFIPPPPPTLGTDKPTYVPTKMEMSLTLLPIQTRAQVSQEFSLAKFANGNLVKGGFW